MTAPRDPRLGVILRDGAPLYYAYVPVRLHKVEPEGVSYRWYFESADPAEVVRKLDAHAPALDQGGH